MMWRLVTKLDGEHVTVTYEEGAPGPELNAHTRAEAVTAPKAAT